MDDDPKLCRLMVRMLEHLGHSVVAVNDGLAAADAYQLAIGGSDQFALCIFDLIVPGGMGGAEALIRIQSIDNTVQAIASSGGSGCDTSGFAGVLLKPYGIEQLAQMLTLLLPAKA